MPARTWPLTIILVMVCLSVQVWGSAQQKGVEALATLDERLEKTPLLEELDPDEMPDEVTDSNGNITQDCSEVSALVTDNAFSLLDLLSTGGLSRLCLLV